MCVCGGASPCRDADPMSSTSSVTKVSSGERPVDRPKYCCTNNMRRSHWTRVLRARCDRALRVHDRHPCVTCNALENGQPNAAHGRAVAIHLRCRTRKIRRCADTDRLVYGLAAHVAERGLRAHEKRCRLADRLVRRLQNPVCLCGVVWIYFLDRKANTFAKFLQ